MKRTFFVLFCLVAFVGTGLYAAYRLLPRGKRQRPNIVLLLVDALRADRLSGYGYVRTTSPTLDTLAVQGVRFTRCYTQAQYTSASTASLFTGRYPLSHGYVNATYVLEEDNRTLAELLKAQGYSTGAFVANSVVGKKYRMDQGFDRFVELFSEGVASSASEVLDSVYAFVDNHKRGPFFVYAHFMDVHNSYDTPEPYVRPFADPDTFAFDMKDDLLRERMTVEVFRRVSIGPIRGMQLSEARVTPPKSAIRTPQSEDGESETYFRDYSDLYDASISYLDEQLGRFLRGLKERGLDKRTLLLVTADHGEQILDHGYFGHGTTVYDEVLRVPLLLYDPFKPELAGLTVADPVRLIDLLPTLLARSTTEIPSEVEGTSLWSLLDARLRGDDEIAYASKFVQPEGVYTEGTWFANRPFSTLMQTYREGEWKLLLDRLRDSKELYTLKEDPEERNDRMEAEPEVAERLYDKLREQYNRNLDLFHRRRKSGLEHEQEKLRELAALGYVNVPVRREKRRQYFPMKEQRFTKFGPFGDEEDLAEFSDHIDLTSTESMVWGQIIRGCFPGGGVDSSGVWFDQCAIFLMPYTKTKAHVVFDIYVDPRGGADNPTQVQLAFNDTPARVFALDGPGQYHIEGVIPNAISSDEGYFYVGLYADRAFVLKSGGSPGKKVYGAMKIRSVYLQ